MNGYCRHLLFGILLLLSAAARAGDGFNVAVSSHANDFVALKGDSLVLVKADQLLAAPFTVLYFGAGWCRDCLRFSPSLVEAYDQQPKGKRNFEVLFLSMDKTAEGMLAFMRKEKMKWPALAFDKVAAADDLKKYYSGKGIPCLSVIDQRGVMVLQSTNDQDAGEVLKQLETLIQKNR